MTGSAAHPQGAHLLNGVLDASTAVLEVLGNGGSAWARWCEELGQLFACDAAAHAWYERRSAACTSYLWGAGPHHSRTARVSEIERGVSDLDDWWASTSSRALVLSWMATPFHVEVVLSATKATRGVLVLGRNEPFTAADRRQIDPLRRHLTALERLVARLEPNGAIRSPRLVNITDREAEVLDLLNEGLLARSIAQRLQVSERTVHKHLGNLYRKLDAHDRLLAVRRAEALGLIHPRDATEQRTVPIS